MALTRLQNIISSVEGRIIYVNPDDFDATDAIDNKGNSPLRPFKTIARAVLEVARYSYVSAGSADDKFDQFTILLYPGDHIVDNRPGEYPYQPDGQGGYEAVLTAFQSTPQPGDYGWSDSTKQYGDLYKVTNSHRGGLIIPRGVSIIGLDLRKTKIRPRYVPFGGANTATSELTIAFDFNENTPNEITITSVTGGDASNFNDLVAGSIFEKAVFGLDQNSNEKEVISAATTITSLRLDNATGDIIASISKPHNYKATDPSNSASGVTVRIPYEDDNSRSAVFRITGGCYFWQFTILDGVSTGVYRTGSVEPKASWSSADIFDPQFSHTKLTVFEYASLHDLYNFYRKVSDAISIIVPQKIEPKIQENRIVGPLSDGVQITKVTRNRNVVTVTLAQELNLTAGNFVNISGTGNFITSSGSTNGYYVGEKRVASLNSRSEFTFILSTDDVTALNGFESGSDEDTDTTGVQITYTPGLSARVEVEIDTVESASPYIFNVSLRSTYGMCGMHADGSRATGFKSMVVAQYTGISLQKDDSAFVKYNPASFQYINDGSSLHTDIDAIYAPLTRSYHVKASNRAVIQAVSVFAVGFADHFIAEDGGDMSITNSNSNFGSNAMRSIGFSDTAFKKDALGELTHIIPPRSVESGESNIYWESLDVVLTQGDSTKLYLKDRTDLVSIDANGTGFIATQLDIPESLAGQGIKINVTVTNGAVTSITGFINNDIGTLQPGDKVSIPSDGGGLPLEFTIGGTLSSNAGSYGVGRRNLNKDGTSAIDKLYVPLYQLNQLTTTEVSAPILQAQNGNVFGYDFTNGNWYVNVNAAGNDIYGILFTNSAKYGPSGITTTPSTYLKRVVDERVQDDKVYRLRYVVKKSPEDILPSFPQSGYVLQVVKGDDIDGVGDRFTDGANLLLLNKYFLAEETVARYLNANQGFSITGGNQRCIDDLIDIVEAVAYNTRYDGNDETYDAAAYYISGTSNLPNSERTATNVMIETYLKPMVENVINNTAVVGSVLSSETQKFVAGTEEQLIITPGGCTNVRDAAYTLLDIVRTAVGTTAAPGNLTSVVRTEPSATYSRVSGHQYNDVYYIYDVEEVVPYSYDSASGIEVEGVYYLTILKGSVSVSQSVLPANTFKFSQNTDNLYPDINIDNVVSDPIISKSIADPVLIGNVKTTSGKTASDNDPVDTSNSITKESVAFFLDEYLNNELEWNWDDALTSNTRIYHTVNKNNLDGSHETIDVELVDGVGSGEIRRIDINPTRPGDSIKVELRRPSTIRSGNHTFEYVGFGPGNYSTGFPIRQTKVLSKEQQKYSQSLKEQGGIAFYSGLNSNGDLYIGNTVINAVTGKTQENQITELQTLTIRDGLNVLGGTGNRIASNFQSPINFLNTITAEGDNIFNNLQLRNASGQLSKLLNSDQAPQVGAVGDYTFNVNPTEGSHAGWVYTDQQEWRNFGLVGTEKIHAYKDSSNNQVLNVGQDYVDIFTQNTVNTNYDLDVTTRQRVGGHLDIGVGANPAAVTPSTTQTKETRLYIEQDWATPGIDYKPLEIKLTNNSGSGKYIECLDPSNTSVFSVDKDGNVAVKAGGSYGLATRSFSFSLTVQGTTATADREVAVEVLSPAVSTTFDTFTGSTVAGQRTESYGFRLDTDLQSFVLFGNGSDLNTYTTNSLVLFINGVIQAPYDDYYFDGTRLYFKSTIVNGSKIDIRCLAK
jgi:hypothetical protein